jgi:hypothetical protein
MTHLACETIPPLANSFPIKLTTVCVCINLGRPESAALQATHIFPSQACVKLALGAGI